MYLIRYRFFKITSETRRKNPASVARSRHRYGDSDSRYVTRRCTRDCQPARREVPRGFHQESLHRPHLHHAWPGRAGEIGAAQAQSDPAGVQGPRSAAGG